MSLDRIWIKVTTKRCQECHLKFTETRVLRPDQDDWEMLNPQMSYEFHLMHRPHDVQVLEELTTSAPAGRH